MAEISENESEHETANLCLELFSDLETDVVTSDIHIAYQVPRCNKNTSNQISNCFKLYFMLSYYLLDCKQSLFFLRSWWAASINPQMHIIMIGYTSYWSSFAGL